MKASMNLKQKFKLNITPSLHQAIKVLQLSTADIRHEIEKFTEENPLLDVKAFDEGLDFAKDSESANDLNIDGEFSYFNDNYLDTLDQDISVINRAQAPYTLKDNLLWQLNLEHLSDIDNLIARFILDSIDDHGFLIQPIEELLKDINKINSEIKPDEVLAVLHRIQRLEPIGCGSRSIKESLLIQLQAAIEPSEIQKAAISIIKNDMDSLALHESRKLMHKYHLDMKTYQSIIQLILTLNPYPGNVIGFFENTPTIPDLFVEKIGTKWQVKLNPRSLPKLSINNQYAGLVKTINNPNDRKYIQQNLKEAKWFLENIKKRQETLWEVASYIVDYQQDFFESDKNALKPLSIKQVADALDMHESTISRATAEKYIFTPRGIIELKKFFVRSIKNANGHAVSKTFVKEMISNFIKEEDTKSPITDAKIIELLGLRGIKISRRTAQKYREELGIASSAKRKLNKHGL